MAANRKRPASPQARRKFLRTVVMGAGLLGVSLLGFIPVLGGWLRRLRPPGALQEQQFLAACIKCGQCVQVCPVEAIKLADLDEGFGVGVPYISDGLQCVLACPTGALTHELNYSHETDMGIAKVVSPASCLAAQGKGFRGQARGADFQGRLRYDAVDRWTPIPVRDHPYDLELCDLCVRQCPIEIRIAQCESGTPPSGDERQCPPQHAIELQPVADGEGVNRKLPVILDGCVGCGVCEMICPVDPTVIVIDSSESRGTSA
jgi:ferredoxin-type protein NapG